jgi:hypothetical protein
MSSVLAMLNLIAEMIVGLEVRVVPAVLPVSQ